MKRQLVKIFAAMFGAVLFLGIAACSNTLRVMSYNVHHCCGMDDKIDYERVGKVINRVQPEVVALQELDSATRRCGGKVCLDELARVTNMYATYAPAIKYDGGTYGIGVLSKELPLGCEMVALPGREEARRLLLVEFEKYVFCCTHLSLNIEDRMASVEAIRAAAIRYDKPLLLAGDMNATPAAAEQVALNSYFVTLNNIGEPTFPSLSPKICIDYIYGMMGNCSYTVKESRVLRSDSIASDHLPVYVDVKIGR